ncbi:MAG: adenosylcobalamin-dependent ribonucleoside-diphosphate reductase [Pseudomonadota bacterium]
MSRDLFSSEISRHVWDSKYRYRDGALIHDQTVADTWRRVALALARQERGDVHGWEGRFYATLDNFRFLPGGRILAGSGTERNVTLFNCFVMGTIEDSLDGIFDALKQGALTMQQGGGVGYDFSTLRPSGTLTHRAGTIASGPVSFMRIWDSMCATLLSTGARRGAMMATLRCDHPDIEQFITAKQDPRELRHFNLSVLVSDAFMQAVEEGGDWPLLFPVAALDGAEGEVVMRAWPGHDGEVPCRVIKRIPARQLWQQIMRATYDYAEPGVLFIDQINRENNLYYRERITATNPCGEVPLPPFGACNLGSVNLTRFIREPFTPNARIDSEALREAVQVAVRLMDNVIDASRFPLPEQEAQARGTRRLGLGITGLADAQLMLGLRYDSAEGRTLASSVMRELRDCAYRASVELAREKGAFPFFEREAYLAAPFVQRLPADIRDGIAAHGIRNSHLTAIAPTGTISLLADNISSGLEPVFAWSYRRRLLERDGRYGEYEVSDHAWRLWREVHDDAVLPPCFVTALELEPQTHLAMQAALQPYVDSAISKTINIPADYPFEQFQSIYREAHRLGLKGCTTFRPNPVTGAILQPQEPSVSHCCSIEREAD